MAFEEHFRRAEQAMAADNYDYAIILLMDVLGKDAKQRRARGLLRTSELKKHQLRGASAGARLRGWLGGGSSIAKLAISKDSLKNILACEEFLKNDPTNVTVLTKLSEQLRSAGLLDQAIDTLEFVRQVDNTHQPTLKTLVDIYETQKEYTKAQVCCEELVRLNPYDQHLATLLKNIAAKGHMQASHIETAGASTELVRDKKKAEELEKDQRIVRTDEEIKTAIAEAVQAIKKNPTDRIAYIKLGDLLAMQNNYKAADQAYLRAYDMQKDFPLRERIGNLRLRWQDSRIEAAELQLKGDPNNAALAQNLQKLRADQRQMRKNEFEMRVKQQPTNTTYRFELGLALFDLNEVDRAIQEFQQSVADPKLKVRTQHCLGRCFMAKGMANLAVSQFSRALEGVTGMTDLAKNILYNLGEAYEQMGEVQKAVETYEKIFETDIGFRDVSKKVAQLRKKLAS
jgi:tetratricopeptide (TPR) repeat protein